MFIPLVFQGVFPHLRQQMKRDGHQTIGMDPQWITGTGVLESFEHPLVIVAIPEKLPPLIPSIDHGIERPRVVDARLAPSSTPPSSCLWDRAEASPLLN